MIFSVDGDGASFSRMGCGHLVWCIVGMGYSHSVSVGSGRWGGGVLKPCLEGGVWWGVDKQCNVCTAPPNLKLVLF